MTYGTRNGRRGNCTRLASRVGDRIQSTYVAGYLSVGVGSSIVRVAFHVRIHRARRRRETLRSETGREPGPYLVAQHAVTAASSSASFDRFCETLDVAARARTGLAVLRAAVCNSDSFAFLGPPSNVDLSPDSFDDMDISF